MNVSELMAILRSVDVPADAYSVGADRDEAYCLLRWQGRWHVYYSERGGRNDERVFVDEAEACKELLDRLLRDGVVRSQDQWNRHEG